MLKNTNKALDKILHNTEPVLGRMYLYSCYL